MSSNPYGHEIFRVCIFGRSSWSAEAEKSSADHASLKQDKRIHYSEDPMARLTPRAPLISQTCEYALRAVLFLAENNDGPAASGEIAREIQIPSDYLSKVLRSLAGAELLTAQRGVGGGFALAKPPAQITVLDVVDAIDGGVGRITECPLGIKDHFAVCTLHQLLDSALAHIQSTFRATSIADLMVGGGVSGPTLPTIKGKPKG